MTTANTAAAAGTNVSPAAMAALAAAGAPGAKAGGAVVPGTEPEKTKRVASPQAMAALALHRARAELGTAILEVLEAGQEGNLAKLEPLARAHMKAEAERKAAEEAERKANTPERGVALAEYRERTNAALALQEYLASTGANIEELLLKAKEQQAIKAADAAAEAARAAAMAAAGVTNTTGTAAA